MITVVVLADVRLYREGLAATLRGEDIAVVGAAACESFSLERLKQDAPTVILIDVTAHDSLTIVRTLRRELLSAKIVAFAVNEFEPEIVAYAEAGIAGYVTADASTDELIAVVRGVAHDEVVCPPRLAATLVRRLASRGRHGDDIAAIEMMLTSRERQILTLIRDGLSNKEIANAVNIAEATVKNHVHHLLAKLKVTNRNQAARAAVAFDGRRR